MRDLTIYIPTYRRLDNQETWRRLSPQWQARAFLVATEEEAPQLRDRGHRVLACPVQGIGPTRQWILDQHDEDLLGDTILMMDDDLMFSERRADEPTKFLPIKPGEHAAFDRLMANMAEMMDYVPLGGLANRSGANRETAPYRLNARLHDLMAINVVVARDNGFRMDRVQFMEDFDFMLQFLTAGYPTLCLNTHCKDDKGGSNAAGGCSTYRSPAGQLDAAMELKEYFPDFVTLVQKSGWGGDMSQRTDVRVAWKKAYEAGLAARDASGTPQWATLDWSTGTLRAA